ncbi:hypothetical protein BP5796_11011 [Coleophoma crateriformis]|uniref:Fe2OG dioxygenase domain-containing protein n=1 Tax=Coleophoma crateriformis TaxID=565419 RepID=A0A3D8QLP3_9HELO|nr:hypothetical protein BP5796_11011 [Coleophoma crateriformis]
MSFPRRKITVVSTVTDGSHNRPPMFEIAEGDLPFVRTRSALLALDLQIDFIGKDCLLPVSNPANFVENISNLVPRFRTSGDVIWFRSQFEKSRVINCNTNPESESVITDNEVSAEALEQEARQASLAASTISQNNHNAPARSAGAKSLQVDKDYELKPDEDVAELTETFLTIQPGQQPLIGLQQSPTSNLARSIVEKFDSLRDLIFQKSHYSAFKDGKLVQTLRGRFVTEIYICGTLTNISVFATAMDAARHGYSITLIEDCCGYRSKARHDEALRRLTEFTGCDVISSAELVQDLQEREWARAKAQARKAAPRAEASRRPQPRSTSTSLEDVMKRLQLSGASSTGTDNDNPTMPRTSASSTILARSKSRIKMGGLSLLPDEVPRDSKSESMTQSLPDIDGAPKRERVRAKVKTRRRPSNPPKVSQNDLEAKTPQLEKVSKPEHKSQSTDAALLASQVALENMTISDQKEPALEAETAPTATSGSPVTKHDSADTAFKISVKCKKSDTDYDGSAIIVPRECNPPKITPDLGPIAICEGDTTIINKLLDGKTAEGVFENVRDEVLWQRMSHQGGEVPRLVSVQGDIAADGSFPIYRHPSDESPPLSQFTPMVSKIRKQVEEKLGHEVNHVLIQYYRDGTDYISEHSDKTLDVVPKTFIANVSLGAQRTMVFRTKRKAHCTDEAAESTARKTCRAPLPHNSLCKMGLNTNMRWLHGIRQDKRMKGEKGPEELAYDGGRISLTFRKIGTFLDKDQQKIWGQGAIAKTKETSRPVVNGRTPEAENMLLAFGKENQSSDFDWASTYGKGFDVLHLSNDRKLFLSGDFITDTRVKFILAELNLDWVEGSLSPAFSWKDGQNQTDAPEVPAALPIRFVDNDLSRSTVQGDLAILMYLHTAYGPSEPLSQANLARICTRVFSINNLLEKWRAKPFLAKPFRRELLTWDSWTTEGKYIAGDRISIVDYALWPLLDEICREWGNCDGLGNISAYYKRMKRLESLMKALDGRADLGPLADPKLPRSEWDFKKAADPNHG